jgi:L-asparaginase / beta-aspartyl-peptidase
MSNYSLAIHGGAGTILPEHLTPELEKGYRDGLQAALDAGYFVLAAGGSATDAVRKAVVSLEDNALFNAGKGSVFAADGTHEMDAAIMEGKELMAGAVSGVKNIRNPVELAYGVMTQSDHVYLTGPAAGLFGATLNLPVENDDYFFTQQRYNQWKQVQGTDKTALDHGLPPHVQTNEPSIIQVNREKKFGTVGAVACDQYGNVAAATSTGGMTNKRWGRVGDTPVIGSGTYANNKTCAISCTGHGELFIRAVAAYDVSCLMEYKGLSLQEAMDIVVNDKLMRINGEGGMIGVDAKGNTALMFNSEGMYRGLQTSEGIHQIAIYK